MVAAFLSYRALKTSSRFLASVQVLTVRTVHLQTPLRQSPNSAQRKPQPAHLCLPAF